LHNLVDRIRKEKWLQALKHLQTKTAFLQELYYTNQFP
jgi:hypothetical protein